MFNDLGKDKNLLAIAFVLAAGIGFINPLLGNFLGEMTTTLFKLQNTRQFPDVTSSDLDNVFIKLIGLAIAAFIGYVGQGVCFAIISNNLTCTIRQKVYKKLLNHDVGYFDNPDNNPTVISAI